MSKIEILSPEALKASYAGEDGKGEYPAYNREEWREAVMHHATEEGYWAWVHGCLCEEVAAEADAEEDMDVSQVSYADKGSCTPLTGTQPAVSRDDITVRVIRVAAEQLGWQESDITPEKDIVDDLQGDSLDQIELVMAIEEEFEIEIPDHDAEKIKTIGQIIDYVKLYR